MLQQLQADFCAQYGLNPRPKTLKHDAIHYLADLGPSPYEETIIFGVYEPILTKGWDAQTVRLANPGLEDHVDNALRIKAQYGHLF